MLEVLTVDQLRHIADLARLARSARDRALTGLPDRELGEPQPDRGEHNPAAAIGLEPLPSDHPARAALQQAIADLPGEARSELVALMWIGQGEYGAKDWDAAVAAASRAAIAGVDLLTDQADLHEHLMKALFEMELGR